MNKLFLLACMLAIALAANCASNCDSSKCKVCKNEKFSGNKGQAKNKKCRNAVAKDLKCKAYRFCVLREAARRAAARKKVSKFCVKDRRECRDIEPFCVAWARAGQCIENADWMLTNCPRSCCPVCTGENTLGCGKCPSKKDAEKQCIPDRVGPGITCEAWQKNGECNKNKDYMRANCMSSCCKNCQKDKRTQCPTVRQKCNNKFNDKKKDEKCRAWARNGECQRNSPWMWKNCARECCPVCVSTSPYRNNDVRARGVAPVGFGGYGAALPYGFRG